MGKFEDAGNAMLLGAAVGLEEFAQAVMSDSLVECPIDTGTTRRSARVFPAIYTDTGMEVALGYGYGDEVNPKTRRLAAEYCVPLHERTEVEHAAPTKAKFLEDPLLLHASRLAPEMAEKIRFYVEFHRVLGPPPKRGQIVIRDGVTTIGGLTGGFGLPGLTP